MPEPLAANRQAMSAVAAETVTSESSMLCAVCSKPLGDAALCNLDEKWVHPDCEADAEWESESAAWSYRLRLAWERRKLAAAETWLRLWGIDGEPSSEPSATNRQESSDEEVLAMWRRGELVVRTGRIHHGNLCVCLGRGDGEWCDKCEGYAMEQGQ